MKIKIHKEKYLDCNIGIVVSNTEHLIEIEQAKQILADLSAAIQVVEPPQTNDAYFDSYFDIFFSDIKEIVDPEVIKKIKDCAIRAMKNTERDTRHKSCEMLQKTIHEIHNMEHRP